MLWTESKWSHKGGILIQYDRYKYKKRNSAGISLFSSTQRKCRERTERESGPLQTKESPELWANTFVLFKPQSVVVKFTWLDARRYRLTFLLKLISMLK